MPTVVIVASCESYRTSDFVAAAKNLRLDAVIATDAESPFARSNRQILVNLDDPTEASAAIASGAPEAAAIVAGDDQGVRTVALATACIRLRDSDADAKWSNIGCIGGVSILI